MLSVKKDLIAQYTALKICGLVGMCNRLLGMWRYAL